MTNIRIGTFIADLRKEQGLTQEQLAERLGVSNRSISRWENGNTLPDYSLMQALTIVLGVSLSELLAGQRLPEDDKTEACVQLALELSKRERDTLRRTLNRCFGFGLTSILCGILFCAEVMRGAFLPVYPVESYACLCFDSAKLCGRKLVLHLQNTVIQLEGHGFDAVLDGLQAFICP